MLTARAVMVDMEPKVIAQAVEEATRSGTWRYAAGQQFCHKRGAGNNWAMGYKQHGEAAVEQVLEMVASESEKCDRLEGFVIPMSVAGGTGSGVGTRLTEGMRDYFPHSIITNQVIWPYSSGEVIVQNYNAMLSLAHLHQYSDAITLIENDAVHQVCARMMKQRTVSFKLMNQEIAKGLEGVLRPAVPVDLDPDAEGRGLYPCTAQPTGRSAALSDLVVRAGVCVGVWAWLCVSWQAVSWFVGIGVCVFRCVPSFLPACPPFR
jgi:tubulin delta